jgi:hypothetical protein
LKKINNGGRVEVGLDRRNGITISENAFQGEGKRLLLFQMRYFLRLFVGQYPQIKKYLIELIGEVNQMKGDNRQLHHR